MPNLKIKFMIAFSTRQVQENLVGHLTMLQQKEQNLIKLFTLLHLLVVIALPLVKHFLIKVKYE